MKRAFGLALLLAVVSAAPAAALEPGPTVLDFEDQMLGTNVTTVYSERGDVLFSDSDSCGDVAEPGGNFGPRFLDDACPLQIVFANGQAMVGLFTTVTPFETSPPFPLEVRAYAASDALLDEELLDVTAGVWSPVVLTAPGGASVPGGAAMIARVTINAPCCMGIDVDDIGFSPVAQPDTMITAASPPAQTASTEASFTFSGNQDRVTFFCKLDDLPSEACTSPKRYSGLAVGGHTFAVRAQDRWGSIDATPATHAWTISSPPPVADRDRDGVADATDNCADNANPGQGDGDGDRIGDACEILPTRPPVAGREMTARVLSGEVFVKLPPGAAASAFTAALRAPFQNSGFVSLKGVASVPVGSVVDARRGRLALNAAINGRPAGDRRQLRREAQFAAGIFAIRQKRASRKRPKRRVPPSAVLTSAPGAERPCARNTASGGPPKGVRVRSLTTIASSAFRTIGGASTATPLKGRPTFITTDRCDGTLTEVGRGRVAVAANSTGRRRTVRAGRAYFIKARLFAARKGRGSR